MSLLKRGDSSHNRLFLKLFFALMKRRRGVLFLAFLSLLLTTLLSFKVTPLLYLERGLVSLSLGSQAFFGGIALKATSLRDGVYHFFAAPSLLEEAREENVALKQIILKQSFIFSENEELKKLLHVPGENSAKGVVVGVTAYPGRPFSKSGLITYGEDIREKICPGAPVMGDLGLLGRIVDVGAGAATFMMIHDENSKIPVYIGETGLDGLAVGTNDKFLELHYVSADRVLVGQTVWTSGVGGIFPRGLPLGTIAAIHKGGRIEITPHIPPEKQHYVRVLKCLSNENAPA